jgi:hypothetical protein
MRAVAILLLSAAAATITGYLAAWMAATGGDAPFGAWLPGIGRQGPFSGPDHLDPSRFRLYAIGASLALAGRVGPVESLTPLTSLAYLAAFLVAGGMLKGDRSRWSLAAPFAVTLLVRALFHTWFEADNFEWLILPVVLVAAFSAGLAHGAPATPLWWRRAGAAVLLVFAAWLLAAHAAPTWTLRERALIQAIEHAASVDRDRWRFIAASTRADLALTLAGVPHATVPEGERAIARVEAELVAQPRPTVVVWDRGILDGMPHSIRNLRDALTDLDTVRLPASFEKLERDGLAYGVRWTPPPGGVESR